jgi:hypothetical protein
MYGFKDLIGVKFWVGSLFLMVVFQKDLHLCSKLGHK